MTKHHRSAPGTSSKRTSTRLHNSLTRNDTPSSIQSPSKARRPSHSCQPYAERGSPSSLCLSVTFPVYSDDEIGMPKHIDKYLVKAGADDDDQDTSDFLKDYFIEVCKHYLQKALERQTGFALKFIAVKRSNTKEDKIETQPSKAKTSCHQAHPSYSTPSYNSESGTDSD